MSTQVNLKANAFKCPLEIKDFSGFNNLIKELNSNKAVKKEYVTKLNNLCYQNNSIIKTTREKLQELKKIKNQNLNKQIR